MKAMPQEMTRRFLVQMNSWIVLMLEKFLNVAMYDHQTLFPDHLLTWRLTADEIFNLLYVGMCELHLAAALSN